jgi:solute carrier family 50 (sugar transporter)
MKCVRDVQMPNVLGLLFGLAQMALYFMYRNPKKTGAVSEIQVVQPAADEISKDQQQLQTHHVADGEVVAIVSDATDDEDGNKDDDIVVDILPLPPEKAPPSPPRPPTAIEVV